MFWRYAWLDKMQSFYGRYQMKQPLFKNSDMESTNYISDGNFEVIKREMERNNLGMIGLAETR